MDETEGKHAAADGERVKTGLRLSPSQLAMLRQLAREASVEMRETIWLSDIVLTALAKTYRFPADSETVRTLVDRIAEREDNR